MLLTKTTASAPSDPTCAVAGRAPGSTAAINTNAARAALSRTKRRLRRGPATLDFHCLCDIGHPRLPCGGRTVVNLAGSGTGAVLYRGSEINHLVLPPFPVSEKAVFSGFVPKHCVLYWHRNTG